MDTAGIFQWVAGGTGAASSFIIMRWVFLRLLGVVFLIAFVSLWVQIKGLIGSQGILPVQDLLSAVRAQAGIDRFQNFPTVFWINASDTALQLVCALGVIGSLLLILNAAPMPSLILLWILYLSLQTVGQDFLSFQWDILLLETGFLAIFFAPWGLFPGLAREVPVPPLILFLFWWLLFRFMLESGVVKLTSGDPTWRNLTALDYHYFTQPLPAWTSWYVHQMPAWFHKTSVIFMYIAEIVLPFLILGTRSMRIGASIGMILLQLIIMATGNYTFFNILSIALCLTLIDDAIWTSILPDRFLSFIESSASPFVFQTLPFVPNMTGIISIVLTILFVLIGSFQLYQSFFPRTYPSRPLLALMRLTQPFALINSYGLFRVMTTERLEIIIEGSNDGETWIPYEFQWKPGDVTRRPRFAEPHQPRLDWQMWFAALSARPPPWFQMFLLRLLEGSPDVLALLQTNPFSDAPPRFIRAELYDYRFGEETWWSRTERGSYTPAFSLRSAN